MKTDANPCPCGGGTYARCCGPLHSSATVAGSAEQLMRSRYSAYARGLSAYLLHTWHPSTRPPPSTFEESVGSKLAANWIGLVIRAHRSTAPDRAEVEFIARCRIGGRAQRLHERSRFVREHGRWLYVDGEIFERPQRGAEYASG